MTSPASRVFQRVEVAWRVRGVQWLLEVGRAVGSYSLQGRDGRRWYLDPSPPYCPNTRAWWGLRCTSWQGCQTPSPLESATEQLRMTNWKKTKNLPNTWHVVVHELDVWRVTNHTACHVRIQQFWDVRSEMTRRMTKQRATYIVRVPINSQVQRQASYKGRISLQNVCKSSATCV